MKRVLLLIIWVFPCFCLSGAEDGKILNFIYCSDLHYGLEREFRGKEVPSDSVCREMFRTFRMLCTTSLPEDGGVGAGEIFGMPDFVVCTGDIANRMEKGVQSASVSWSSFLQDWDSCGLNVPLYLVPGNHDISNAIGYPERLSPERDAASAAGIYNLAPDGKAGDVSSGTFDYVRHKTRYSFVRDSIRFVFMGMWPDAPMREWFRKETAGDGGISSIIFTHDPPEADAKHFTNPCGNHGINSRDRFENLLADTCTVRSVGMEPVENWRVLEDFIRSNPEIKAYFHGDKNYNEFYVWHGPGESIALPVFRVDSPMKGEYSSLDETLLSFIVVSIDPEKHLLTARECLWNSSSRTGIRWGETRTVEL